MWAFKTVAEAKQFIADNPSQEFVHFSTDQSAPARRSTETRDAGDRSWPKFTGSMAMRESSGNPKVENSYGYLGLYQLGESALAWTGFYNPGKGGTYPSNGAKGNNWFGTFTGKAGVDSKTDYLDDADAQTEAFTELVGKNFQVLQARGLLAYDGSQMNGTPNMLTGMLAAAHLRGAGSPLNCQPGVKCVYTQAEVNRMGLQEYLESNGRLVPQDETGTPLTEYIRLFNNYNVPTQVAPGTPVIPPHQVYPRAGGAPAQNPALDDVCLTPGAKWGDDCDTMRTAIFTDRGEQQVSLTAAIDRTGSDDPTIRKGINADALGKVLQRIAINAAVPRGENTTTPLSDKRDLFATECSKCDSAPEDGSACMSVQLSSDGLLPADYAEEAQAAIDTYAKRLTCNNVASSASDAASHSFMIAGMVAARATAGQGAQALADLKDSLVQTVRSAGIDTDAVANSATQGGIHGALRGASKVAGAKLGQAAQSATYYGSYAMWRAMQAQNDGASAEEAMTQAATDTVNLAVVETVSAGTSQACHAAAASLEESGWTRTASAARAAASLPRLFGFAHTVQNQGAATAVATTAASMGAGILAEQAVIAMAGHTS